MKRNLAILIMNMGLKALGSFLGAMISLFSGIFENSGHRGANALSVAVFAGYCALGYMVGNLLSTIVALLMTEFTGEKNAEKEDKGE